MKKKKKKVRGWFLVGVKFKKFESEMEIYIIIFFCF